MNKQALADYLMQRSAKVGECRIWQGALSEKGYGMCGLGPAFEMARATRRAHRLSYTVFVGAIPSGFLVCHHCDNPSCIEPSHLFLGTAHDNSKDMFKKGRWRKPVNPLHLSEQTVRDIYEEDGLYKNIAEKYGVLETTVARIKTGETYKRVTNGIYNAKFGHNSKARRLSL